MKIMVIDDEPIVPKALRKLIPWEEYGFCWLPEAYNGQTGLELILKNKPDLILVDCRMPLMDGLELLSDINRKSLPIKSIILSGHDEFEYAQQAIKLGAADYLLKPPDIDLLLDTVLKVKEEWLEEKNLKQQFQDNLPLIRYKFVQALMDGAVFNEDVLQEKIDYLNLNIISGSFYLMLLHIEEDPDFPKGYHYEDQQLMNFAILNIIEESLSKWPHKYSYMDSQFGFIIIVNAGQDESSHLLQDLRLLIHNIKITLHYGVNIGVSLLGESLSKDAKAAYIQAKNALQYKYYTGPNEVIFLDNLDWESSPVELDRSHKNLSLPHYKDLLSAFKVGNPDQLNAWLADYIQYLKDNDFPVDLTKTLAIQGLMEASQILTELHPQLKKDELLTPSKIASFLAVPTHAEMENEFRHFLLNLLNITTELRKAGKNTQVQKAKQFIQEHYSKNITLDSIAKEVFLSPVYLSFLFKQVENMNLTDFLTHTRLEKAKELLRESSFKTYEISNQVGYHDEKYFSRLFKKKVGMTPTEYRFKP